MADFDHDTAMRLAQQLAAQRMEMEARYTRAKADGDHSEADDALEALTVIDAKGAALDARYNQEMARRNPKRGVPETDGEFMSREASRMNYNDTLKITGKSKYKLSPEQEVANLREGISELQRRKASGDIQT
jgi:hypothetical protein